MQTKFDPKTLAVSIVSHGHGHLLANLLEDLRPSINAGTEVFLTINIPEDESFLKDYSESIVVIRNSRPLGFGENHNNANMKTNREWFLVLNPDVRLDVELFGVLICAHRNADAGVVVPRVVDADGNVEDSVRCYPTFARVLSRVFFRFFRRRASLDYDLNDGITRDVDWAAGMFLLFKSSDFRSIGGFDIGYFMYLEDADICLRFNSSRMPVIVAPEVTIIHNARRASRKSLRHFWWHLCSLVRFLIISRNVTRLH